MERLPLDMCLRDFIDDLNGSESTKPDGDIVERLRCGVADCNVIYKIITTVVKHRIANVRTENLTRSNCILRS